MSDTRSFIQGSTILIRQEITEPERHNKVDPITIEVVAFRRALTQGRHEDVGPIPAYEREDLGIYVASVDSTGLAVGRYEVVTKVVVAKGGNIQRDYFLVESLL